MTRKGEQRTIIYKSHEKMQREINEFSEYGWKVKNKDVEIETCGDDEGCYEGKYIVTFEYVGVKEDEE